MNSRKKDSERGCLEKAILEGKKSRGATQCICALLDGPEIERKFIERPDFVKQVKAHSMHFVIGIEHFRVDHSSMKKTDGSIASTGIMYQKDLRIMKDKYHNNAVDLEQLPSEATREILDIAAKQAIRTQYLTYDKFLESFKYSMEKHLKKVDIYKKNIQEIATHRCIKICFLIEIYTEFSNLILNDKRGAHKNITGLMPLFGDIIRLLEGVDKQQVQYIVLQLNSTEYTDKSGIIAFSTGNIKKQLEKQNIPVYEYAGDDCLLKNFQTPCKNIKIEPSFSIDDGKLNAVFNYSGRHLSDEQKLEFIYYAAKRALYANRKNMNYATTMPVQMFLEVCGEYIYGWRSLSKNAPWRVWPIMRPFSQYGIEKKMKEFERKWGLMGDQP